MAFRLMSLGGKFGLAVFITRFMNLSDLGSYSLVAAAAALTPALFGFGLNGSANRDVVGLAIQEAMAIITTRLVFTLGIECLVAPAVMLFTVRAGDHINFFVATVIAVIVALEHLSNDLHGQLIGREMIVTANAILCVRTGGWCTAFVIAAFFVKSFRSLPAMLLFWAGSLAACWIVLGIIVFSKGTLRLASLNAAWLRSAAKASWPFYLYDVGSAGSQNLDRLIMSHFFPLDVIGGYSFFASLANALSSITYFGVLQPASPLLIASVKTGSSTVLATVKRCLIWDALKWSLGLSLVLLISTPLLIQLLHKKELINESWILWPITVATILRTIADAFHFVMYAQKNDRAMAGVSLTAIGTSALLNVIFIPIAGILGVAIAYVLTSGMLLVLRHHYSNQRGVVR